MSNSITVPRDIFQDAVPYGILIAHYATQGNQEAVEWLTAAQANAASYLEEHVASKKWIIGVYAPDLLEVLQKLRLYKAHYGELS